jgi:signal transduction histidine kinase
LASMAYELHDGPCQFLASALYHLDGFRLLHAAGAEDAWEEYDHGLDLLERGIRELRTLLGELRPARIGQSGLVGAVEDLIHENTVSHGLSVEFSHNLGRAALPAVLESTVLRIVQEGLANVRRHSHSRKARLEILQNGDSLHLECEDWGVGFDPLRVPKDCFGLEGMRTRAALLGGRARIASRPRLGTLVAVDIPIQPEEDRVVPRVSDADLPAIEVSSHTSS